MHYTENVLKYRVPVIIISLAFVIVSSMGMGRLTMESDGRIFFGPDNPMLKALDDFEATFNRENGVIFAIDRKDGGDIFNIETIGLIKELTDLSWEMPFVSRVDSMTNFQHTEVEGDELLIGDLVEDELQDLTIFELQKIKAVALKDPLLQDTFVSSDGLTTAVIATSYAPTDKPNYVRDMSSYAYGKIAELELKYPGHNFYITGGAPFDDAFAEQSEKDMSTLTPFMFLMMVVFIYLFLHSFTATISVLLVMVFSVVTAMGLAGWAGLAITSPSAMAPIIIFTLAVADSIHILSNMFREMVFEGRSKYDALVHSMKINFRPVFITSLTTAIGFLSMNFSDAPPFHDLGNIAAVGVMAAFVYSVTFLPAFVSFLPASPSARGLYSKTFTSNLAEFVISHENKIFYSSIIIIAILIAGVTKLTFDDNFAEYFDESNKIRIATEYTEDKLIGLDVLEYAIRTNEDGGINEPEYLNHVESFVNFWRAKEEISDVYSVTDIYKRLNKVMNEDKAEFYKIPDERNLAAQYLLLYEMGLPFGMDLNNRINQAHNVTRITVYVDADTVRLRELAIEGDQWLKKNLPEELFTPATGLSLLFAYISKRNIEAMLVGTIGALVLISFILIIALKSFKMGMISLVPNLVPAFCAFGLWGFVYGEVGLAVAVVTAISIGIVVDDTVHLLTKYMAFDFSGSDNPSEDAIRFAFARVGNAIIITSVVIAVGFGIMALSGFKVNSSMGILTASAVVFALLADLLFLPTLLMKLGRLNGNKGR